jgi:hypothetical protein
LSSIPDDLRVIGIRSDNLRLSFRLFVIVLDATRYPLGMAFVKMVPSGCSFGAVSVWGQTELQWGPYLRGKPRAPERVFPPSFRNPALDNPSAIRDWQVPFGIVRKLADSTLVNMTNNKPGMKILVSIFFVEPGHVKSHSLDIRSGRGFLCGLDRTGVFDRLLEAAFSQVNQTSK